MNTNIVSPRRLALLGALCVGLFSAAAQAQTINYIGQQIVPSGTLFQGTVIGGLSGIDRRASDGRYLALSDDRSGARFYELALDLGEFRRSANPGQAGVNFLGVTTLRQADGTPYAANTVDPESLRLNPTTGRLVWSNEGQRGGAGLPALQNPTVREMGGNGVALRDYAVPPRYNPAGSIAGTAVGDSGIRNNLAFESLTFSTDGATLYTATENALVQDGPAAAVGQGSVSRILSFNAATGAAGAEYAYPVAPVVLAPAAGGFATNGLVELLAVGDRQFVAVERSFATGAATPGTGPNGLPTGNSIRLYYVDARGATDVSGFDLASGTPYTAVNKTLLLDLSDLRNDDGTALALDNIEGITWGPEFQGRQTLLLVSDNNFAGAQFTQFVALSLTSPIPEPASLALWAAGGALLLVRRARAQRRTSASR